MFPSLSADLFCMTDLERENAMLRGVLLFAAREIRRLNFGRRDSKSLEILRKVWRDLHQAEQ